MQKSSQEGSIQNMRITLVHRVLNRCNAEIHGIDIHENCLSRWNHSMNPRTSNAD